MRGDDLRFDLAIEFEEAIFGTEKEIKIRRLEACETCKGTRECVGTRAVGVSAMPWARTDSLSAGILLGCADLQSCEGRGSIIGDPCLTCRGETRLTKEIKLTVKVPPGVEEGTRIRYTGEGDVGRGGGPERRSVRCACDSQA